MGRKGKVRKGLGKVRKREGYERKMGRMGKRCWRKGCEREYCDDGKQKW